MTAEPPAPAKPRAGARAGRWSAIGKSPALPIVVLCASLMAAVSFSAVRHGFYRAPESDRPTYNSMARVSNLSADHGYLVFERRTLESDGEMRYTPYNRFPVGGLLLLKAVIAPFDSLSAQLLAARVLMMIFFSAAALTAYMSLRRLTSHGWISLMATLLAVSSYYWKHADMVSTEYPPGLFAFMLTFHGMVIFVQEGRFRQLLVRTGAALLLDWHVYALLLPFVGLGFLGERFRVSSFQPTKFGLRLPRRVELIRPPGMAVRSRFAALGGFALVFGLGVLAWNFNQEYHALGGEGKFTEIPSFQSFLYRTGQHEGFSEMHTGAVAWGPFSESQFHRLGRMALPFGLPGYEEALGPYPLPPVGAEGVLIGVFVTVVALVAAAVGPGRLLYLTLVLSGFVWAFPMRHVTAFHDIEMIYYLGVMLVFFATAFRYLRRVAGDRLVGHLVPAVLLVFVVSADRLAERDYAPGPAWEFREMLADFDEIQRLTSGAVVFVPDEEFGNEIQQMSWFLAGRVMATGADSRAGSDYSISRNRVPGPELITPRNRHVFLYDHALDDGRLDRMVSEGEPVIRSTFDVYWTDDWLIYVREPCVVEDTEPRFFLHLFPVDETRFSIELSERGFENRDFVYTDHGIRPEGRCLAAVRLPEYEVRSLTTGQFRRRRDGTYENLWRGEFALDPADASSDGVARRPGDDPDAPDGK